MSKDRGSPSPSLDDVWQDLGLENLEIGTGEPEVEDPEMVANGQDLLYPSFPLEFNADGSGRLTDVPGHADVEAIVFLSVLCWY